MEPKRDSLTLHAQDGAGGMPEAGVGVSRARGTIGCIVWPASTGLKGWP